MLKIIPNKKNIGAEIIVNLKDINPGVTVTSFLSKQDVNQKIVAMYNYIENS